MNRVFPARTKTEPNSFLDDNFESFQSDYGSILVSVTPAPGPDNDINCVIQNQVGNTPGYEQRGHEGNTPREEEISYVVEEAGEEVESMLELEVEAVNVQQVAR